ncbi:PH domain-containing protein [Spiractinospora alimapuensis]|uniref:PH domain-containing protein n=1 Tax=Spiractinospora alimapuensis TaxID=2820884 RepID=UPI001F290BB8|nr:PH domain-containing protein [Spiractinospora alimapuensis]QVQ51147.1 PH domain-containing protein [Spiractinospora alimapuensis]
MGSAKRYLADDERLVHATRQHWCLLIGEFLALLIIVAVVAVGVWLLPAGEDWASIATYVLIGIGVLAVVIFWFVPLLKWRSTLFILSDRRLLKRFGIIAKHGRDIPLARINDVSFSVPLLGRLLRYGTLHVQSASEQGVMRFKYVPHARWFQSTIYSQVAAAHSESPRHSP